MEKRFQEELDDLKQMLLGMGAMVERNIGDAVSTIVDRNRELAVELRGRDPLIDLEEIRIDNQCVKLLALQQPVASDLRFIATALKIVKDLERVGDIAVDISKLALQIMADAPVKRLEDVPAMAELALKMLKDALDSFVARDPEMARRVIKADDGVDEFQERILEELQNLMMDDRETIPQCLCLLEITRQLERVGDHSCNLAEMVVYLVEGEDIRHRQKIRPLLEG